MSTAAPPIEMFTKRELRTLATYWDAARATHYFHASGFADRAPAPGRLRGARARFVGLNLSRDAYLVLREQAARAGAPSIVAYLCLRLGLPSGRKRVRPLPGVSRAH